MPPEATEVIREAETIITVSALSIAGVLVLIKIIICESIDAVFDVKEKRTERRKKFEELRKTAGGGE